MMSLPPLSVLRYGSEQSLPPKLKLRAGPLCLIFEEGALRYMRYGEHEALRGVYVAVRDHQWNTIVPRISDLVIESTATTFRVTFEASHHEGPVDYMWRGTIEGNERGTVSFAMDGEVRSDFERNRIGFCVLHPSGACAGQICLVQHTDGTATEGRFPYEIAPHQPFKRIRSITHECQPGVWLRIDCAGEIFEMEDQRNWTDESFKTYCTPLDLPLPVMVKKGTKLSQKIIISLEGDWHSSVPTKAEQTPRTPVTFRVGEPTGKLLPQIGLRIPGDAEPLSAREIERLKALNLSHLRIDLLLADAGYQHALRRAAHEAKTIGASLEVALHLSDHAEAELANLKTAIAPHAADICRWLVFKASEKYTAAKWVALVRDALHAINPQTPFCAGTTGSFVELNRASLPLAESDGLCYSINPQSHAFDNASLMETLKIQAATIENARRIGNNLPIIVGPVTFKPQALPFDRDVLTFEPGDDYLPRDVDVRQMSLFGAAWTAGSLKYVAAGGAKSVTYFETTGWRGVMERESGSPSPALFPSLAGAVFPLYHVLADAGEFSNMEFIATESGDPSVVDGFAMRGNGKTRIIVTNLSNEIVPLVLHNVGDKARVSLLDESNVVSAMKSPESFRAQLGTLVQTAGKQLSLELQPYAVLRIDAGES